MMDEMARRKGPARPLEDMPEWMRSLKGFDELRFKRFDAGSERVKGEGILDETAEQHTFKSGTWRIAIAIPRDIAEAAERTDPILLLPGLAHAIDELESKVGEIVRHCRANGRSWTQIGDALSISKQAAWERFSGEQ
jgi:hypothetical protein